MPPSHQENKNNYKMEFPKVYLPVNTIIAKINGSSIFILTVYTLPSCVCDWSTLTIVTLAERDKFLNINKYVYIKQKSFLSFITSHNLESGKILNRFYHYQNFGHYS